MKPERATRLRVATVPIPEAQDGIVRWHRHLPPAPGALVAFAVYAGETVVGYMTIGRPVAPTLARRGWLEVTRVATNGHPNACSALYGAAARYARHDGGRQLALFARPAQPIITYTLPEESGASLRAAGWVELPSYRRRDGGQWGRPCRSRPVRGEKLAAPKRRWSPAAKARPAPRGSPPAVRLVAPVDTAEEEGEEG